MSSKGDVDAVVVPLRATSKTMSTRIGGGRSRSRNPTKKTAAETEERQNRRRRKGGAATAPTAPAAASSSSSRDENENDDDDEARDPRQEDGRGDDSRGSSSATGGNGGGAPGRGWGRRRAGSGGGSGRESSPPAPDGCAGRPRAAAAATTTTARDDPSVGGPYAPALADSAGAAATDDAGDVPDLPDSDDADVKAWVATRMDDIDDDVVIDEEGGGVGEDVYADQDHGGLVDVNCPSWDLLNQDSFGFNLLGSQGSLSFDTGDHHHIDAAERDDIVGNDMKSAAAADEGHLNGGEDRCCGKSMEDLTSTVTASLDELGGGGTLSNMDWGTVVAATKSSLTFRMATTSSTPTVAATTSTSTAGDVGDRHNQRHHQHHREDATMVVNSMNHNWIPPISLPQHNRAAHHHQQQQQKQHHHHHHHHHQQQQQQQQQQHHAAHHHQRQQQLDPQRYHGVSIMLRSSPYHPVHHHSSPPSYFVEPPPPPLHHHYPSHPPPPPPPPPPPRESRSDITHNGSKDPTEMREDAYGTTRMGSGCNSFEDDPFKYAFGSPDIPNGNNTPSSSPTPPTGMAGRERGGDRIRATSVTSSGSGGGDRRSKKRKQDLNTAATLSQPLPPIDERRNPSSTTRPRQDKSSSRDVGGVALGSSRKGKMHENGNDTIFRPSSRPSSPIVGSNERRISPSKCHHHGISHPSPPMSSSVAPYLQFTSSSGRGSSGAPVDTIHSAFLPPVPMTQRQQLPLLSSATMLSCRSGTAPLPPPCREVYITTKTPSSTAATIAMNGKPPPHPPSFVGGFSYAHHPPPPYNYPPPVVPKSQQRKESGAARAPNLTARAPLIRQDHTKSGWTAQANPSAESHHHYQSMQQQQQRATGTTSGIALLALPDGKQLSRSQAPGIGWPPEEDSRLTEVMSNHKSQSVDWEALSLEHGVAGRTARECHDRWTRYLRPGSRKGQWREEEDAIVLRVIFSSGGIGSLAAAAEEEHRESSSTSSSNGNASISTFTQWADLAPQLPGRTGKQIRDRWVNYLNPAINHLPFSRDDDLQLWRGHKDLGKRWVEISVKVFHSTRSENHIKNRWYSAAFKKFVAKEFGVDAYFDTKQAQDGDEGGGGGGDDSHHRARD